MGASQRNAGGRQASGSDTRTRIVETAARLFHERGFHATGLAAIREESGVNSGSIYYFFDSKEAILEAVLALYEEALDDVLVKPVEEAESDPLERVFKLLDFYRKHLIRSGFGYGCPIGKIALEVGVDIALVRKRIENNFKGWRRAVQDWLSLWAAQNSVRLEAEEAAALVLAAMEGAVMQASIAKDIAPFDNVTDQLRSYFRLMEQTAAASAGSCGAVIGSNNN